MSLFWLFVYYYVYFGILIVFERRPRLWEQSGRDCPGSHKTRLQSSFFHQKSPHGLPSLYGGLPIQMFPGDADVGAEDWWTAAYTGTCIMSVFFKKEIGKQYFCLPVVLTYKSYQYFSIALWFRFILIFREWCDFSAEVLIFADLKVRMVILAISADSWLTDFLLFLFLPITSLNICYI